MTLVGERGPELFPIDPDDSLDVRIAKVNAQAKAISRRGKAFQINNATYEDTHANLDYLVACIRAAGG